MNKRRMISFVVSFLLVALFVHAKPFTVSAIDSYPLSWVNQMNQASYWENYFSDDSRIATCDKYENHNGWIPAEYDAAVTKKGSEVVNVYPDLTTVGVFQATHPHGGGNMSWVMKCKFHYIPTITTTTTTSSTTTTTTTTPPIRPTTTTTSIPETTTTTTTEVPPSSTTTPSTSTAPTTSTAVTSVPVPSSTSTVPVTTTTAPEQTSTTSSSQPPLTTLPESTTTLLVVPTVDPPNPTPNTLPETGATTNTLVFVAVMLLGLGVVVLFATRRSGS